MITVSDKYKKAIKSSVRQVNAFVELLVDARYIRKLEQYGGISSDDKAEITVLDTTVDDNSAFCNYASLEEDYFLLDGSFILPNRNNNKETGFIGDINSSTLNINNINYETPAIDRNKKCITIYFENGYATNFDVILEVDYGEINLRTLTYNFVNNDKKIVTTPYITDLDKFKNIKNIEIIVNNWSNPSHRVRIRKVLLGESVIYENNEIIEINTNEQTDIYNIELPNNDCSIKLNNYDRKFNVVDENNILNRLTNNSVMRIFHGISIDGCYDYLCMGNFEFNSYTDENNQYTTLNGIGNIENLESQYSYLADTLIDPINVNYVCDIILNNSLNTSDVKYNQNVPLLYTNFNNSREQLQALAIISESYVKQTRKNEYYKNKNITKVLKISNNIVDKISLDLELEQPKFTKKNKAKKFVIRNSGLGELNSNEDTIYEETILPVYDVENNYYRYNLRLINNEPIKLDTLKFYINNVEYTDILISNKSYYQIQVSLFHLSSEEVNLKITAQRYNNEEQLFNLDSGNGETIEYINNYLRNEIDKRRVAINMMNLEKPYLFEFEMMSDPSLEIGDTILFENIDGYKKGIITSIETKYNGALTSIIKGECENVL